MSNQPLITLNNGQQMPRIALGTAKPVDSQKTIDSIQNSIKIGYRHIDTAAMYQNESEIGQAIQNSIKDGVVSRQDLFITSKLQSQDKGNVLEALKGTLQRLQVEYLDLYLIHWPGGYFDKDGKYINFATHEVWKQMEQLIELKLVKSIGVCNFGVQLLVDLCSYAKILPAVNQVELHPYFQQKDLQETCQLFNIQIMCYSPLCRGGKRENNGKIINVFEDPVMVQLSEKYGKSQSELILAWHLAKGNLNPIPRSENTERLTNNLNSFSIKLENEDIEKIDGIDANIRMVLSKEKYGLNYFI